MNKYSFDIELDTVQPFVVDLDLSENNTQTISGAIVLKLAKPESFRVAEIAIHGHVGLVLNSDTEDSSVVHETLIENTTDLIAANDTEGDGVLHFNEGTQYIPFRIDLIRPNNLAPSLINRLDTEFIDWKYEIHATLRRNSFFSVTRVVKHDLILRRLIEPTTTTTSIENELVSAIDLEGEYRSKLTCPSGRIVLGQDRLQVQLELEARSKEFAIKEVDCAIVQTEEVDYLTKDAHPSVKNAHSPGVHRTSKSSRLVTTRALVTNNDADLDFGQTSPIEFDLRIDNDKLLPTDQGLDWFKISHALRYTIRFLDVSRPDVVTELPIFVVNQVYTKEEDNDNNTSVVKTQQSSDRLVTNLKIAGTEDHHLHFEKETTPELEP